MQLIDTHCHLTFPQLYDDVEAVIRRSREAGVIGWVTVGTEPGQIEKAVGLAEKVDDMYAAIGYHPHNAKEITDERLNELRNLAQNPKVVAIGETGIDYFYTFSEPDCQREIFRAQLEMAVELDLPVIIHSRDAFDEVIEILDEFSGRLKNVVIHCFSGSVEQARAALERGFYISFTGIVTFKKADQAKEVVAIVPVERMMVETDCPFISPAPFRNQKPNEPALMIHTARMLADLKQMDIEDFATEVTAASKKFFNLP